MSDHDYIADLQDALLAVAVDGLAAGRTGRAAFKRAFKAHGIPVWEFCAESQITVHLTRVAHRQNPTKAPCAVWPEAEFHIQFVRCVPDNPEGETPGRLDESAGVLLDDLGCLLSYTYQHYQDLGMCDTITYGDVTFLGPSGGVGGYDVVIRFGLSDSA